MLIVMRPDLIVLKIAIASLCDSPDTDSPLIDSISSPEHFDDSFIILQLSGKEIICIILRER